MTAENRYSWKFFRAGGLDQVMFRDGRDLTHLDQLDQKLWVALSCPTRGVEFDTKTLDLIDTDKDGRIRAPELLAALQWASQLLKNPDDLTQGGDALPLAAINDQNEAGARLLAGAKRLLANLNKAGATAITLTDTADTALIFAQTKFNGDGIVPADCADDAATQQVINEIMACCGSEPDRSGKPGVNQAKVDAFFAEAQAYADWWAQTATNPSLMPLGDATANALEALRAVRAKVDDYFARCFVAAFDARAAAPLNRAETEYVALALKDLTVTSEEIARLPLARIEPGRPLSLIEGLNPAWKTAVEKFRASVVTPLLGAGRTTLTWEDWTGLAARFAPYEAWRDARTGGLVEKLGLPRVRAILGGNARAAITALIAQDAALATENAQVNDVDRLIRFYRDLNRLAHNYVNLVDFYNPKIPAIFQVGRLHMDGRTCDLCFHVEDIAKHATFAGTSKIYLAYCELTRAATGQKQIICAAFTAGFAESLWVGRNGIFYDRQGHDWDAVIVKTVESPISLKEAFWAPWRKIATMVSEQIKKVLAAREAAALAAAAKTVAAADQPVAPAPPPPTPAKMDGAAMASSVAAIGVAVGILGVAVGKLLEFVKGASVLNIVLGVICVIGAVSLPAVILAYFKLRARDLAPILNACGWAVNRRIRMTLSLGRVFTQEAKLPEGAARQLTDPYADKNTKRNLLIALLVLLAALYTLRHFGLLDPYLPASLRPPPAAGRGPAG